MARIVIVKEDRCLGCRSCELACAVAHSAAKELLGALAENPRQKPRVHVEGIDRHAVPMQCHHCEDAPCLAICPTGAIYRQDEQGPVLIETQRCIGCKFCVLSCPFGSIELSRDGRAVIKCDRCVERLAAGAEELPACVNACPTGALEFAELDEYIRRRRREALRRVLASQAVGGEPDR